MEGKKYTIQELSELTGFTRRTIRYYIQESLLEPPAGRGRGGFYYDSHLEKLLYIKSLQERGLNLSAIADLLKKGQSETLSSPNEIWVKYSVIPGLEINVRSDLESKLSPHISELISLARAMIEEKNDKK